MLFLLESFILALVTCTFVSVQAKYVFAHFVVGIANGNSVGEWLNDIQLAIDAHIDGFALNIGAQDGSNAASISNAFTAANQLGNFKLFFSFDYAAQGAWSPDAVVSLINQYKGNGAYFLYGAGNQPLVSTFEGPGNTGDWTSIKAQTSAFFIPDWDSIGPSAAWATSVADGLFSWSAWPNGPSDKDTNNDLAYLAALSGKGPYMMPVSPWFFTNLPGWSKNWLWRGDDLWYDRWEQVAALAPDLVEIISWNDFGESHYIGPLRTDDYGLFSTGGAPFNYADRFTHDGWRALLPYVIDTYKNGAPPAINQEQVVAWYRVNPNTACGTGGTTGNAASQNQVVYAPQLLAQDEVFFSVLLNSDASVDVTIGGTTVTATWRNTPAGGSGIYHGSVPFNGNNGLVYVTAWRMVNGQKTTIAQVSGPPITGVCQAGIENWNAWVGNS